MVWFADFHNICDEKENCTARLFWLAINAQQACLNAAADVCANKINVRGSSELLCPASFCKQMFSNDSKAAHEAATGRISLTNSSRPHVLWRSIW
jgi:hypothetical protein